MKLSDSVLEMRPWRSEPSAAHPLYPRTVVRFRAARACVFRLAGSLAPPTTSHAMKRVGAGRFLRKRGWFRASCHLRAATRPNPGGASYTSLVSYRQRERRITPPSDSCRQPPQIFCAFCAFSRPFQVPRLWRSPFQAQSDLIRLNPAIHFWPQTGQAAPKCPNLDRER